MGSLYPHQFEGRSQQNLTLAHQQQLLLASAAAPPVAHGSGSRAWGAVFKQLLLQTHATPPDPLVESCQQQPECGDRDTDPSLLRWESECKRKQDCLSDERRVSSTSSTTAGMSLLSALLQGVSNLNTIDEFSMWAGPRVFSTEPHRGKIRYRCFSVGLR